MSDVDLRYLEGRSAIGECIQRHTGGRPNDQQKAFAASCLLHGRLFWQSAASATLETRPLLLYYGAAAYAKALVLAFTGCKPEDLRQAHGLRCSAKNGEKIADFCMQSEGKGLFQQFNDVVASQNRIRFFEGTSARLRIVPASTSDRLTNLHVSLSECLARIPDLQGTYEQCTKMPAKSHHLQFHSDNYSEGGFSIRVDVPGQFDSDRSLQRVVTTVRDRVPFLRQWRLRNAVNAWDNAVLEFENVLPDPNEFVRLVNEGGRYSVNGRGAVFDAFDHLAPLAGGFGSGAAYIESIDGEHVSEFSLMLAALLGLSSLVRYFPHIWTACVYRQPIAGRAVDDELLPVIEQFLRDVASGFPTLVTHLLLGQVSLRTRELHGQTVDRAPAPDNH